MLPDGTSAGFDDAPVTPRLPAAVSASPTVNPIALVAVSSVVLRLARSDSVGGALGGAVTVNRNVSLAENCPSLTVSVIVAVPDWPATGVIVTVRVAPLPPNTRFPADTSAGLDDDPVITRLMTVVSVSVTVKLIGPVDVSCAMV